MRYAKNSYYLDRFKDKHESNFKFWKTFSSVLNPNKKKKNELISKLNYKNDLLTDNNDISNAFNDYFSTVGEELNSNYPINTDF